MVWTAILEPICSHPAEKVYGPVPPDAVAVNVTGGVSSLHFAATDPGPEMFTSMSPHFFSFVILTKLS